VSRNQKGKTNLDFSEARDSEWQWHQLGRMQVCTLLQEDNHASIPALSSKPISIDKKTPIHLMHFHSILVNKMLTKQDFIRHFPTQADHRRAKFREAFRR